MAEASDSSSLPEAAADLYAADLDEFVSRRDALAKELKQQGEAEGARAVKALRKPTVATWAINQAVRRRPEVVKDLLESSRDLGGARSGAALRKASSARQEAIRALVDEATSILDSGGHGASSSVADKITQTLLAVSVDPDAGSSFARGMLERELEPDLGFGFPAPSEESEEGPSPAETEAKSRAERLGKRAEELEDEVGHLERRARDAQERLQLAQMELDGVKRQLESARDLLGKARKQAAEAANELEKLKG